MSAIQQAPVPDDTLRRVSAARRAEAELAGLTGDVAVDDPAKVDERRRELLDLVERDTLVPDVAQRRHDLIVAALGEQLLPWQVLNLPYMSEGVNQSPGVPGTSGTIATAGLYAGGLGYGGAPADAGTTDPGTEKWRVHNWHNSVVFPAAPSAGRLYYRFTVDSESHVYRAPVHSGSIREFVTIGWTSDVATDPIADWHTWRTVGWPVDESLPSGNLHLGGSVPVFGSIPVRAGHSAALGFIYGTIVSVARGLVQFAWGNFGTRLTLPTGTTIGYQHYDKLEYRFEPDWWVKDIGTRLRLPA